MFALMKPQWKDGAAAGSSDTAVKLQSPPASVPPSPPPASFLLSVLREADNPYASSTHSRTANLAPAAEPRVALALLSAPSMDTIH